MKSWILVGNDATAQDEKEGPWWQRWGLMNDWIRLGI